MNKLELIKCAKEMCEKELKKEIESNSIGIRFDKLMALQHGLNIAETIAEGDLTENAMHRYLKRMIEDY